MTEQRTHYADDATLAHIAKLEAEVERLRRLKAKLEDACDTVDGPDGEPRPNLAMSLLGEWENGL